MPNLLEVQFGRGELAKPIHWGLQADGSVVVAGNARATNVVSRVDLAARGTRVIYLGATLFTVYGTSSPMAA